MSDDNVVAIMANHLLMYISSCTLLHGGHTCTAQLLYDNLGIGAVNCTREC